MAHLFNDHGERIRLLAGRSGRAPNANATTRGTGRNKLRHDDFAKMLEGNFVTKEEGFVGRHCLDNLLRERLGICTPSCRTSSPRTRRPARRATGKKTALDQIFLILRKHESGAIPAGISADNRSRQLITAGLRKTDERSFGAI